MVSRPSWRTTVLSPSPSPRERELDDAEDIANAGPLGVSPELPGECCSGRQTALPHCKWPSWADLRAESTSQQREQDLSLSHALTFSPHLPPASLSLPCHSDRSPSSSITQRTAGSCPSIQSGSVFGVLVSSRARYQRIRERHT